MSEEDHCQSKSESLLYKQNVWEISLSPLKNHELSISLSLLKIGKQHLTFLFLFSKMEKLFSLSLSLLEA